MKKKISLFFTPRPLTQQSIAQVPKWVEKTKRTVFSVVTRGESGKILNTGNGFFVTEDGIALSNYSLFKGVQRAVAVNSVDVQMSVVSILGANDMYDVIKFRVDISTKKMFALNLATVSPTVGVNIYISPYSTQRGRPYTAGQVRATDKFSEEYYYYTLNLSLRDEMVGCSVMTEEGEVFAPARRPFGVDTTTICYVVDANPAMAQSVSMFSFGDMTLKNISIKRALPDTEEEALVFLFMVFSQVSQDEYAQLLDDFIAGYLNGADGYMRRATDQLYQFKDDASMEKVEADMDKALSVIQKRDNICYNCAKLVCNYMLSNPEKPYKDWSYDRAADEVRKATVLQGLPVYVQVEGDILFTKQDYPAALACYKKVSQSDLASVAIFFSTAKTKELVEAPAEEILVPMDNCVTHLSESYTEETAPYLLERTQAYMDTNQARAAMLDYGVYYKTVNGKVNDVFYYYHEQATLEAKQFQRAPNDLKKAIKSNPKDLTYRAELAVINTRVGHNEETLKISQDTLTIDPEHAEAYHLMGIAQLQVKKKQEARQSFAKVKNLGDPNVDESVEKRHK